MRSCFGFGVVLVLAGCGGSTTTEPNMPASPDPEPDAGVPMMMADAGLMTPARGFVVTSPTVDVNPRSQITFCYYFHTPNSAELSIQKWASHMTTGVAQMVLFFTTSDRHEPGTLLASDCGMSTGVGPVWIYSAETADAQTALPDDDGNGYAVGHTVRAGQPGFLQMSFQNTSDAVVHAHVELAAYAHGEDVQVTPAAPFVTFNTDIDLPAAASPAMPTIDTVSGNCTVAASARFFLMSTHTYKQGTHTIIKDGTTTVFENTGATPPSDKTWTATPPFSFASGKLSYQCDFKNPNGYSIRTGDNPATDERCVARGYYFPAEEATGHFCLNSAIIY